MTNQMEAAMDSVVQQRGAVMFPEFTGERVYMHEFRKPSGLPKYLARWKDTVDAMLDGIDVDGPIYLMVDQARVMAGTAHRRPGVHVDGFWEPARLAHGHPGHGGHRIDGETQETLLLASNVMGCRGYVGSYAQKARDKGDCSHVDLSGLIAVDFEPYRCYSGHALTMLHESVPLAQDALRTVVRLNVAGYA